MSDIDDWVENLGEISERVELLQGELDDFVEELDDMPTLTREFLLDRTTYKILSKIKSRLKDILLNTNHLLNWNL